MFQHCILSALIVFAIAVPTRAVVIITVTADGGIPTPGLPGFKTFTFSVDSNYPIHSVDAARAGSNDPIAGYGFLGPMNQVNPFGLPTVFTDNNSHFVASGAFPMQDSQFLVHTAEVQVPPGLGEEGSNILQGAFAWRTGQSGPIAFAQIVTNSTVCYRCQITASSLDIDAQIDTGCVAVPEPRPWLLILSACLALPRCRWNNFTADLIGRRLIVQSQIYLNIRILFDYTVVIAFTHRSFKPARTLTLHPTVRSLSIV